MEIPDIHQTLGSTIKGVKEQTEAFLSSNFNNASFTISSKLRKSLPELKDPSLHYVALGSGKEYQLLVSKLPIRLTWEQLSEKSHKMFSNYKASDIQSALSAIVRMGCERDWINRHYDIENRVQKKLLESRNYQFWKRAQIEFTPRPYKFQPVKGNDNPSYLVPRLNTGIYSHENNEKMFISLDLKAANYQVLRLYGVVEEKTWDEFIGKFTDDPYFRNLKKLRLKALSSDKLFPNKQRIVWQNMTVDILDSLLKSGIVDESMLAAWNSDELLFHTDEESEGLYELIQEHVTKYFGMWHITLEQFTLYALSPDKPYFVKRGSNDKVAFRCVAGKHMREAQKLYDQRFIH
jgi:hypothetical protein